MTQREIADTGYRIPERGNGGEAFRNPVSEIRNRRVYLGAVCLFLLLAGQAWGFSKAGTIYTTDGTLSDIIAAVDDSSPGDTVDVPAATVTFTGSDALYINSKGIHLRGAGSGRIIARSQTSHTVGTGEKTFTISVDPKVVASVGPITASQILKIMRTGRKQITSMTGTVTSYNSGTGELVMDITSVVGNGTGPWGLWHIATMPLTKFVHDRSGNESSYILVMTEPTSGPGIQLSGIHFTSAYQYNSYIVKLISGGPSGKLTLVHDCWFSGSQSGVNFSSQTNRGVIYKCSVDDEFYQNDAAHIGFQLSLDESYGRPLLVTAPTWGADDTTGLNNFYVEDCDFHSGNVHFDQANFGRSVVRNCLFNNAGSGSHGADTGFGNSHHEIYNNAYEFVALTGQTIALNWWFQWRGGPVVIHNNIMPDIESSAYPGKADIMIQMQQLRRYAGDYPCWGGGVQNRTITAISATNPAVITVTPAHYYITGQKIRHGGTNSTPVIDNTYAITRISSTQYSIPVNVTVAGTAGGTVDAGNFDVTSISAANPTVITTSLNHSYVTGQKVRFGNTNSTPVLTGPYTMTVLSPNTFSLPVNVTVAGTAGRARGVEYPGRFQPGYGHNGTDYVAYPGYFWNNKRTQAGSYVALQVGSIDYPNPPAQSSCADPNDPDLPNPDGDTVVDYVLEGRDFFNQPGGAELPMPGYVEKVYPHPLRTAAAETRAKILIW